MGPAPCHAAGGWAPDCKRQAPLHPPPPPADTVSVVGITQAGKEVAAANTLQIRTSPMGAPTIALVDATSPTSALVELNPPPGGVKVSKYVVKLCLAGAPTRCVTKASGGGPGRRLGVGLSPGAACGPRAGGCSVPSVQQQRELQRLPPLRCHPAGVPLHPVPCGWPGAGSNLCGVSIRAHRRCPRPSVQHAAAEDATAGRPHPGQRPGHGQQERRSRGGAPQGRHVHTGGGPARVGVPHSLSATSLCLLFIRHAVTPRKGWGSHCVCTPLPLLLSSPSTLALPSLPARSIASPPAP